LGEALAWHVGDVDVDSYSAKCPWTIAMNEDADLKLGNKESLVLYPRELFLLY
jgi:hypothetical protein